MRCVTMYLVEAFWRLLDGAAMSEYAWSEVDAAARQRLDAIATWTDPLTLDRLVQVGVATGWRCAEIGAGTGTIAAWLADRVGPGGAVLATDLDTRWLDALGKPNVVSPSPRHCHRATRARSLRFGPLPQRADTCAPLAGRDPAHGRRSTTWRLARCGRARLDH